MATVITSECINCGACEPECPNTAIYQGGVEWELNGVKHPPLSMDIFYIVPEKCTECVGFHDREACAVVCPVDCCIPDPQRPESEAALLERAKQLHPGTSFPADFPSRFKAAGDSAPSVAADANGAPAAAPSAATAAASAPVAAAADNEAAQGPGGLPDMESWDVPIECHHCKGSYAVEFRHFRSGVVFYCPFCQGSTVVTTSMHNAIAKALHEFYGQWERDYEMFQEKRRRQREAFEESLRNARLNFKPPGSPRKRAWIFG
jgi:ferredoxin